MLFDEGPDYAVHKFWCDCGNDSYQIFQDKLEDGTVIYTSIDFYPARGCSRGFWTRLKRAFKYLFWMDPEPWYDVIVRPQDIDEIIEVLKRGKNDGSNR